MYNKNKERILKYLKWEDIDDQVFEKRMQLIPYKYRNILEVRWGLVGENKICPNYKILGNRLYLNNPKQEYEKALNKLVLASFAECIADAERLPFEDAVTLAGIAVFIWEEKSLVPAGITGDWILIAISNLPVIEQIFLNAIFWQEVPIEELVNEEYSLDFIKEYLDKARKTLKKQWKYVELLDDSEVFSFKKSVSIGQLASFIYGFNNLSPKCVNGQRLLDTIEELSIEENKIIKMFAKNMKAIEIKEKMNLEIKDVQKILESALKKVKSALEI